MLSFFRRAIRNPVPRGSGTVLPENFLSKA
ncbi:hypothetical protein U2A4042620007 [Corynebacterium striatum]|nr:hypothetical protein U2A4042620007 [Corynebacterium striatum]